MYVYDKYKAALFDKVGILMNMLYQGEGQGGLIKRTAD
jgi:hypothetical protein